MGMTESDLMVQWEKAREETYQITRQEWMDRMDEVEVLTYIIAFLYHYDVGTEHISPENFDDKKWDNVIEAALDFFNSRLGEILVDKLLEDFYKKYI